MRQEKEMPFGLKLMAWSLRLLLPLFLLLTSLRMLLTVPYVQLSYSIPGFPDDPYGFTRAERERWAAVSLQYLLNDEEIDFLGHLQLEDGSSLFNSRELRHMRDVKVLTKSVLSVWLVATTIVAGGFSGLLLFGRLQEAGGALLRGGRWTLLGISGLALLLLVSFSFVFVGFHRIFFEGNTWLFFYSDTLIRLFPERFWQQVFAALVLLTAVLAGTTIVVGRTLAAFPIEYTRRRR